MRSTGIGSKPNFETRRVILIPITFVNGDLRVGEKFFVRISRPSDPFSGSVGKTARGKRRSFGHFKSLQINAARFAGIGADGNVIDTPLKTVAQFEEWLAGGDGVGRQKFLRFFPAGIGRKRGKFLLPLRESGFGYPPLFAITLFEDFYSEWVGV